MEVKGVALILRDSVGRYLLHLRDGNTARMPYQWAIIGGLIDEGESPLDAVIREAKEETGFDIKNVLEFKEVPTLDLNGGSTMIYTAELDFIPESVDVKEGLDIQFLSPIRLKELFGSIIYSNAHLDALKEYAGI